MQIKSASDHNQVAIILCTYNPDINFFKKQLHSIEKQTIKDFNLYIFDDGSDPNVLVIMRKVLKYSSIKYTLNVNKVKLGFQKNFLSGLLKAESHDYYCFCDQDDIWLPTKIAVSLSYMSNFDLYCSSTSLIDEHDKKIGTNTMLVQPSFNHALVQSIAGGNTFFFNQKIRKLIKKNILNKNIISHDWLIYLLASAVGHQIFYNKQSHIHYRLHRNNTIGTSFSLISKFKRVVMLFKNKFRTYTSANVKILDMYIDDMACSNKDTFIQFKKLRQGNIIDRLSIFFSLDICRASFFQNVMLLIALALKKI